MFRRFRPRPKPDRAARWKDFAARLDLRRAAGAEAMLRDLLDLSEEARLEPVYRLEKSAGAELYLFDHTEARTGPAGSVERLVTVALLAADHTLSPVSLRATRKLNRVLESLGASRVGGVPVELPHAPGFGERVTLYARSASEAAALITPAVREVLERALCAREAVPILTVAERHLVLRCRGEQPVSFEELEHLTTDLLSLYAALEAQRLSD